MRSFHGAKIKNILVNQMFALFSFVFCPRGHLMDYHLPNVDNRGHLANYHLPHFVHVVIERPPRQLRMTVLDCCISLKMIKKFLAVLGVVDMHQLLLKVWQSQKVFSICIKI